MFREEQRARQRWVSAIAAVVAVLAWTQFIQQVIRDKAFGSEKSADWVSVLILLLAGIGLPLLIWRMRMVTTVDKSSVTVQWQPFTTRRVAADEITSWHSRQYRPVREYGGWGLRGSGDRRALNASGNQGVELELKNGANLMIGSQRPEELATAIATLKDQQPV